MEIVVLYGIMLFFGILAVRTNRRSHRAIYISAFLFIFILLSCFLIYKFITGIILIFSILF